MHDVVISNTSPIFYLHRLKHLSLLRKLYDHILVPKAVVEELMAGKEQGEDVPDIGDYNWIEVRWVNTPELVGLITDLGPGEAQVLTLAIENPGSLVLLDDGLAREIAGARNIKLTGTAGILLKAKQEGHIEAVEPLLRMLAQLGFRLSTDVINIILKLAQESTISEQ